MVARPRRRRIRGSQLVAVAYVRVSTDQQDLGPEAQRAAIEAWAAREGVTVASWHVDKGVSGAAPVDEREGFVDALQALSAHRAGLLVVAKRDRLARDVRVAAMAESLAERFGARVVCADGRANGDTPDDEFMRGIDALFAARERALIRARTRAALSVKRTRGERVSGHAPYGFRFEGDRIVEAPAEQATIAKARELRGRGLSFATISEELECLGMVNRNGKPFALSALHTMLSK